MATENLAKDPPWLVLPAEISDLLRPALADVVERIIETIPHDVPDYALPMEGRFGQGIRTGVQVALSRFLDLPGTRLQALSSDDKAVYDFLGRGEVRSGRSLESLLAAYRSGARVTFRAISDAISGADHVQPLAAEFSPSVLLALGESIFAYIDEISAASAQGYAQEQSERAGEQQRLRSGLVEMVLRGDTSEATLARHAATIGWTLPEVVVVATVPFSRADGLRAALGPDALVVERGTEAVVLYPFGNRRMRTRELERALAGRHAIIGPPRPLTEAAESLHLAVAAGAYGLGGGAHEDGDGATSTGNGGGTRSSGGGSAPGEADGASAHQPGGAAGSGAGGGVTGGRSRADREHPFWVADHLADLIVRAEPLAMADLARRVLSPLAEVRPAVRERLAETLLAWLRHRGQWAPVAAELFVHPQTVGYRLGQLRELFGAALDDPQTRFELELVLRAGHH